MVVLTSVTCILKDNDGCLVIVVKFREINIELSTFCSTFRRQFSHFTCIKNYICNTRIKSEYKLIQVISFLLKYSEPFQRALSF